MLSTKNIGFIGGGNMAAAFIGGLVESQAAPAAHIICSDVREEARQDLAKRFGVGVTHDNLEVIRRSEIVVYAVKPQVLPQALRETAKAVDATKLIISIAAGVPLAAIALGLGKSDEDLRLIRVMPNICALVGESATAIATGAGARPGDADLASALFNAVGKSLVIGEHLLDAFTGLCGSGPSYVFLIIEALADAGVNMGLSRQDALLLAGQTLFGSAKMLLDSGEHPAQLRDRVTSPGGTSIAGVHALEQGALRATLINAVAAATERSRQLGRAMAENFSG
ncbi:MAG: pyrroline-5-carboxylate reductase [Desulfobulbaceae bacterium]|nr:pyrroline-5-carboxylate reductase [Desulfobulbaceae bacterium]